MQIVTKKSFCRGKRMKENHHSNKKKVTSIVGFHLNLRVQDRSGERRGEASLCIYIITAQIICIDVMEG